MNKIKLTSVEIVTNELKVATDRLPDVSGPEIPFNAATQVAIPLKYAEIVLKKSEADTADSNSIAANAAFDEKLLELQNYENSYCTVLFLKVKDGIYPESLLPSFGIPTTSRALPYNISEIAAEGLVAKIATGDAQIVVLGLPHMVDYNYVRVNVILGELMALKTIKIDMASIADVADKALVTSFDSCVLLIEDMRAQEDYFYRLLKDGTFRDALRNWGVVFEADAVITEVAIKSKFTVTGADANGATWHIGKALTKRGKVVKEGVSRTAVAHGEVVLPTAQDGDLILTGTCPGCVQIIAPITLVAGTNQSLTFKFDLLPPEA